MIEIGIVVKSGSKREYTGISTSNYTTTVSEYDIIGVSYIDLASGMVVARKIDRFDSDYRRGDYPYITLGGTFSITKAYNKNGISEYESYIIDDKRTNTSSNIANVLPVYTEDGELLASCNGSKFVLYGEDGIYLVVDIKKNVVMAECGYGASNLRLSEVYRSTPLDFKDYVGVFKSDIDGVYTFSDICYVYGKHIEKVIPPEECRRLIVSPKSEIDTLVLNNNIKQLELVYMVKTPSIKTIYISKDISKSLLGNVLNYFVKAHPTDYSCLSSEMLNFCRKISHLHTAGDDYKIYDFCMCGDNKKFMGTILSDYEIVVY